MLSKFRQECHKCCMQTAVVTYVWAFRTQAFHTWAQAFRTQAFHTWAQAFRRRALRRRGHDIR